ncbi:unnamed protein product [Sphacelaria rigidula]
MLNVNKRCGEKGCSKPASFGAAGGGKAEFCVTHAPAGMLNVESMRCSEASCSKRASFGAAACKKVKFCATHTPAGAVDVKKRCGEASCSKRPSFSAAYGGKAEFCATHASANMVNVKKRCGEASCSTPASFGAAYGGKAEFCATHASANMVNVKQRCGEASCSTPVSFGAAYGGKAEFCATHASANMVNVKKKRCGEASCSTRASFGAADGGEVEFCATHVRPGMVGSKPIRCGKQGCSTRPSFGVASGEQAKLCSTHARPGRADDKSEQLGNKGRSKRASVEAADCRAVEFCAPRAGAGSMTGNQSAIQRRSTRVGGHENTCLHVAHDPDMVSDAAVRVHEKECLDDESSVGETGVDFDGWEARSSQPSDADANTNDSGPNAHSRRSSRAVCAGQRGANFMTSWRDASGQSRREAAADGASLGGTKTRMTVKLETTAAPAGGSERKKTSAELITALSGSPDGMDSSGYSSNAVNRSYNSSITCERSTKRLRMTEQVGPLFDVAAGHDVMSEGGVADVKSELDVSASSRCVSVGLSCPRGR